MFKSWRGNICPHWNFLWMRIELTGLLNSYSSKLSQQSPLLFQLLKILKSLLLSISWIGNISPYWYFLTIEIGLTGLLFGYPSNFELTLLKILESHLKFISWWGKPFPYGILWLGIGMTNLLRGHNSNLNCQSLLKILKSHFKLASWRGTSSLFETFCGWEFEWLVSWLVTLVTWVASHSSYSRF